jgi:aryl-alcohol dehydrogenase-like predicted oxidoreductase
MHQRHFPALSKPVSEIGIGTWQLGGTEWGDVPEEEALSTLAAAADVGVTFIDTADIYGLGRSESLIGRFLKGRPDRDRFVVATKLGRHPEPGWPANFTRDIVRKHTEDSLRRLGVDVIDLTQTHSLPLEVMRDTGIFDFLRELRDEGKIKAFGASVESVEEALFCLDVEGMASLQIIFNIFRQKPIDALFDQAQAKGIALIIRLPLASGLLAGKFTQATTFAPNDHRSFNRDGEKFNVGETFAGLPFEKGLQLVEKIRPWVPAGMTMAQMALRWCLDFEAVTTVIPGAKRPDQARANAAASDLPMLSPTLHNRLGRFYETQVAPYIRGKY